MSGTQKIKKCEEGEGRSTAELFQDARVCLRVLEEQMRKRSNRDRASMLLTDAYVALQEIGQRFAQVGPSFEGRRPNVEAEEEERQHQERPAQVSLAELMSASTHEEQEISVMMEQQVRDFRSEFEAIERVKLIHFRQFLEFMTQGCRQVTDVTRKVVAIARRVRPELLRELGMSQVEVSRKFGEQRATTSAREKRVVERTLKSNGTKGYQLLGGVKSATHRENCRKAQQGNTNRRSAEERKKASRHRGTEPERITENFFANQTNNEPNRTHE